MPTLSSAALTERAAHARDLLRECRLCPRECGVDRTAGETGFCGLDDRARWFREVLHYGEEEELVPSHQVYFAGCNLRCEWCAVSEWNRSPEQAEILDMPVMRECILRRMEEGARTLNLLGGEPTVSVAGGLELLAALPPEVRVVWNTNAYYTDVAAGLLDGAVDVYLADLKVGNEGCGERLLGARDYVAVARERLRDMQPGADLIVRHLILPGHWHCCAEPVLRWIGEALPGVKVSLRGDYLPPARATHAPSCEADDADRRKAADLARELGLNLIV